MLFCAAINYGLKAKKVRQLDYKLARHNNKKFPASCGEREMAGEVWPKTRKTQNKKRV